MKWFAVFMFVSLQAAASTQPVCEAIGTRSEGWYRDGQLIRTPSGAPAFDQCDAKFSVCSEIDTRSEGWYIVQDPKLLTWSDCATARQRPVCDKIGTEKEGWYLDGKILEKPGSRKAFEVCNSKVVYCGAIGSRSEGWYTSDSAKLLIYDQCNK